jgi:hypothetical protein
MIPRQGRRQGRGQGRRRMVMVHGLIRYSRERRKEEKTKRNEKKEGKPFTFGCLYKEESRRKKWKGMDLSVYLSTCLYLFFPF